MTVVDGGRTFADQEDAGLVDTVRLPAAFRDVRTGNIRFVERGEIGQIRASRARLLAATVARVRPHALFIEYFPFQRLEFSEEIESAIRAARNLGSRPLIASVVRDIPRPVNGLAGQALASALNLLFDCVLVQSDERFARLEDRISTVPAIAIPVIYTGFVAPSKCRKRCCTRQAGDKVQPVVASFGGGAESVRLAESCLEAWTLARAADSGVSSPMVLFGGPFMALSDRERLHALAIHHGVECREFSHTFRALVRISRLSISRAGYNTCVDILGSGVPSILIPSSVVSDQVSRARKFERLGLALCLPERHVSPGRLARAILRQFDRTRSTLALSIDGVAYVERFLSCLFRLPLREAS